MLANTNTTDDAMQALLPCSCLGASALVDCRATQGCGQAGGVVHHLSRAAAWRRAGAGRAGACRRAAMRPRAPAASGSTGPPARAAREPEQARPQVHSPQTHPLPVQTQDVGIPQLQPPSNAFRNT